MLGVLSSPRLRDFAIPLSKEQISFEIADRMLRVQALIPILPPTREEAELEKLMDFPNISFSRKSPKNRRKKKGVWHKYNSSDEYSKSRQFSFLASFIVWNRVLMERNYNEIKGDTIVEKLKSKPVHIERNFDMVTVFTNKRLSDIKDNTEEGFIWVNTFFKITALSMTMGRFKRLKRQAKLRILYRLSIGKTQTSLELWNFYKKQNILIQLAAINFSAVSNWRWVLSSHFLKRLGRLIVSRFGLGYTPKQNGRMWDERLPKKRKLKKGFRKKLEEAISKKKFGSRVIFPIRGKGILPNTRSDKQQSMLASEVKKFIGRYPDWLNMNPRDFLDYELLKISGHPITEEDEKLMRDNILPEEGDGKKVYKNLSKEELVKEYDRVLEGKERKARHLEIETEKLLRNTQLAADYRNPEDKAYIPWVFGGDCEGVVSEWTGVPVSKVTKSETIKLLTIEKELQKRVIGQLEAVQAIAKALRRGRLNLRDFNRPIASFLFSGPTGVGKTEVTKALAESYFGGESDMIRFDMSEFMERHTVSKLIGSPPGYIGYKEGGQLTGAVRRKPYAVILFDEVEKAHPDVFNLLLQVLEDGRLSDSQGRVCDFKNTIIVMTSNLGAAAIQNEGKASSAKEKKQGKQGKQEKVNFNDIKFDSETAEESEEDRVKELVHDQLKSFFRPEFINRIDEIIIFRKLTKTNVRLIALILLTNLKARLFSQLYNLILSDIAVDQIVEEGFDPDYGARPLRRVITQRLEDNLAVTILERNIQPLSVIWVNYENNEFTIEAKSFVNRVPVSLNNEKMESEEKTNGNSEIAI